MEDLPTLAPDPLFDEYGDYWFIHSVAEIMMKDPAFETKMCTDPPSILQLYSQEIKPRQVDYEKYISKFTWLPVDVIKKTFEATTQHYRTPLDTYLRKWYKSPFPACNVHCWDEPVATDTVYADTPAIDSRVTAAKFFVGTKSLVCDIYPIKTDKQFVNVLLDNIRNRGAMTKLISDSARVETSNKVQGILRNLMISDWQSEPHQQHQNPAEWQYQVVKRLTNNLLDCSGAPGSLWFLAMSHVCLLLNYTVNETIGNAIPLSILTGTTQDISALLHYDWFQPVYYREEETRFPSMAVEKYGWIVGIAENVGHALTFKVLSEDTQRVLHWSVIWTATDSSTANIRAMNGPVTSSHPHVWLYFDIDDEDNNDNTVQCNLPCPSSTLKN